MSDNEITGQIEIGMPGTDDPPLARSVRVTGEVASVLQQAAAGPTDVRLGRTATEPTEDQPLWVAIRNRTQAISFNRYHAFINRVLCVEAEAEPGSPIEAGRDTPQDVASFGSPGLGPRIAELRNRKTIFGMDAYKLLKLATEAFVVLQCGFELDEGLIDLDEESRRLGREVDFEILSRELAEYLGADVNAGTLPYFKRILEQIYGPRGARQPERLPYCEALLRNRLSCHTPIELIWSYWQEEGMLVQTMNAISLRFQNRRSGRRDPLVNMALDPLRPMSNLLWGFVQGEPERLSLQRRVYEYAEQYNFTLVGKAVPEIYPADSRSKFIEAFHNLLHRALMFYREDDDTTVVADAFALLNALREVHLILAQGANNQSFELPFAARVEMLMMQWLLARPEIKEFLRGRYMVPYQEPWQGAVDDMKKLKGWNPEITVTHFHELAEHGEQILLSVRLGDWIEVNDQALARNWGRFWRSEIQRYLHAYHAVTGVDLTAAVVDTRQAADRYLQPSAHLSKRARLQRAASAGRLGVASMNAEVVDFAHLSPAQRTRLLAHLDQE